MSDHPRLTDRAALLRNRARACRTDPALFLQEAARDDVQDRLAMVNRRFTAPAVVTGFPQLWQDALPGARIVPDDAVLDLEAGVHDLVIHALALHWADDPVGQLIQCRHALKPDGLMLAATFGGQTLHELRAALASAEAEVTGGLSPRILPMGEIRDLGALLQRAGFALPVADGLPLTASYQSALHLMRDLRAMGEGNALSTRLKQTSPRALFARTEAIYREHFATKDDRLPATFELVCLTGWSPSDSQQQPLRPGSAKMRLAEALKVPETKLPD